MTSKRIALLFAGQGAQVVGMGKDLAAKYTAAAELFVTADRLLGRPLSQVAFAGPEAELTETKNCQPALFVHGLACLAALREEVGDFPVHCAAGLSLGEFTAHAAAGTFDFEHGLQLVAQRGLFMQEACEQTKGAMAAMIGGTDEAVEQLARDCDVDLANFNNPGQIVISGEFEKVERAVSLAKERGIRMAKLLNVAGAYHSRLMGSAYVQLGAELEKTPMVPPRFPVFCNVEARPVTDSSDIRRMLQAQVTGSVRWTQIMERLVDEEKIELFIEIGPGGALAGMLKRTRKDVPCISISDSASLEAALPVLRG